MSSLRHLSFCLTHLRSLDLAIVVITTPAYEEATVPLKPLSEIRSVIGLSSSFPILDALTTGHSEFLGYPACAAQRPFVQAEGRSF